MNTFIKFFSGTTSEGSAATGGEHKKGGRNKPDNRNLMNGKIAKKIRQYAKRDYKDLFRHLLDLPLRDRIGIALRIIFKR